MRVAIGADHAGYELKQLLAQRLAEAGHSVTDLGTHSDDPVDYPDYAAAVGRAVAAGKADRGILVCGSGAGVAVAANKLNGVRCTLAHDTYTARQAVEHDDVNAIAVGARVIGVELAWDVAQAFLRAEFSKERRHVRRLKKVKELEQERG